MKAEPLLEIPAALRGRPEAPAVLEILAAALRAADPAAAVARHLRRDGDRLVCASKVYDLAGIERVFVVGFGKAGAGMAAAVESLVADRIAGGLVIVKEGYLGGAPAGGRIEFAEAGHPLPDVRGLQATRRLIEIVAGAGEGDLLICLISGGGSALLTAPAEGLGLPDLQAVSDLLLAGGTSIQEFNAVRRQLSAVKGGRLARLAAPARVLSLILSDVVGDDLIAIASGPTAPDPGSFAEAVAVLKDYGLWERVPEAVRRHLEAGVRGERPGPAGPGDSVFTCVRNVLIGSNRMAADAAVKAARELGFDARLLTTGLIGEARDAGERLAGLLRRAAEPPWTSGRRHASGGLGADGRRPADGKRPVCLVAGGETVVALGADGRNGRGGRNQELALAAVKPLAGLPDALLLTLATDGGDGPTDAAGAAVTGESLRRAAAQDLDPRRFLERHDSYSFFEALGDLVRIGPTGTNVNDLAFLFAFGEKANGRVGE
ncbi:MAG TPA: DUF4147 domain-containing protein [Anaerolineales bacterium]|nr:DUF4147 domain-containing protein [Anaerolineales bacterium]